MKRYQLWHHSADACGDVTKDCYDTDTVGEAISVADQLRTGCFDIFKLFDTTGDMTENLWSVRLIRQAVEECQEAAAVCDAGLSAAKNLNAKLGALGDTHAAIRADLNRIRPVPTNPATFALLDQISAENIRASLSKHDDQ